VYYNDPMGDDANDQAMSYYQQLSKAINRNNNREQWERERSEGWRSTTNKMQMFGVVGDDDLFPKLGIGSGNGSLSHQGFEEANVRARETGGKVAYSAGEYWTETQILEFVIDPLFIGYSPGVLAIKNQTQGYNIRTSISSSSQFFSSATNGSVPGSGSDFLYDNNNAIGLGIDMIEPGFGAAWDAVRAAPGAYTNGAKIAAKAGGVALVGANVALTTYTLVSEYQNGTFNTHSIVNGAVTVVGVGLTITGLVISAPVVAVIGAGIGIGYGISQIAGSDAWIDSNWGFNKTPK